MNKIVAIITLCLALAAGPAFAHNPAADIVDPEIYAMIDDMVADTPHATMVFDEEMGTTTITAPSVSDAEDLVDDYLLAAISLLDEDVTITITFEDELEAATSSVQTDRWTERDDWGKMVIVTIDTLLCIPDDPAYDCIDILPPSE